LITQAAHGGTQVAEIIETIVSWIENRLGSARDRIDINRPLTSLGLDSLKAVALKGVVDERYGTDLAMEWLFDGVTVSGLATLLAEQKSKNGATVDVPVTGPETVSAPLPRSMVEPRQPMESDAAMQFSLFYFASDSEQNADNRYRLLLESTRFADEHGFTAVWTPERHFHKFGGLFPNPSVVSGALAVNTKRLRIRAGSVVVPLHDPVRVAEEWSVVDNLSGGRVDIAFATGWNSDDFVFFPDNYPQRQEVLLSAVRTIRELWKGAPISRTNGNGKPVDVRITPQPVQSDLPVWITCSGGVERFEQAGALGANVITALLFQDRDELAGKIAAYRRARAEHGHDPATGQVTLMLHTHLGFAEDEVRQTVAGPFRQYLADSVDLWRRESVSLDELSESERDTLLSYAFERYYRTNALFGTPDSVAAQVEALREIGVGEIACLIDFGVGDDEVLAGLTALDTLRQRFLATEPDPEPAAPEKDAPCSSFAGPVKASISDAVEQRHALARRHSGGVLAKAYQFDLSQQLRDANLLPFYTELTRNEGTTCLYRGRQLIMLGSNNYLGLTADDRVRKAVAAVALTDGPSLTGSRLLNGSTSAHVEFEQRLAHFLGRPDALLFTTGYQANIGLLSAVMGVDTVLIVDDEAHASIYDGAGVGQCDVVQFRHNDVDDLRQQLVRYAHRPTMVMVDGVYSMSGDVAPLPELKRVCAEYDVPLAVDDAHGLGMVGATGRGVEEMFDAVGRADILTGTFSKSLASVGGWMAGQREVVEWVRYHGRPALFSAAIPPTALAAASAALDVLIAEPWRVDRIRDNAEYWRAGLVGLGFDIGHTSHTSTAIVPVIVGDEMRCLQFARALLDGGLYANCVVAPAVPANRALMRTSVMATHQTAELDQALEIFARAGKQAGIIS
jgi:natural product biosynthesis luciferase-like monooxygenase protein